LAHYITKGKSSSKVVSNGEVVQEDFTGSLGARWTRYVVGTGAIEATGKTVRLLSQDADAQAYSDAQIDDYQGLPRGRFPWSAPLTLTVRARFSHTCGVLKGTAGFGFWNDPFFMTGRRLPTLPRAMWFFYASAPSNMKLDLETPGRGWKAATIDAQRWPFLLLLPTAPAALPLMNIRRLYQVLWPIGQRAIGVNETQVDFEMTDWHTFVLEWSAQHARFLVDNTLVLATKRPPRGRLGFVMWLDNQYAIVTPWGRIGHGYIDAPGSQWLEVDWLTIIPEKASGP
jgi:hypothetical protein